MKKKYGHVSTVLVLSTVIFLLAKAAAQTETSTKGAESATPAHLRQPDRRPSFWTKTANSLKASTLLRANRFFNRTKLSYVEDNSVQPMVQPDVQSVVEPSVQMPRRRRLKPRIHFEMTTEQTTTPATEDLEDKIMKDESFLGLKEFANQLVNETTAYFVKKKSQSQPRSYPIEEPPQHQLWDDKDQTYHASNFATAEYEPTSFHHHYIPPPPVHYFPQKKDDALFTKFALIALLKLILAKLKAIGFLKLMLFFLLKIPILFFKFLFVLKGFKLLKLVSIPFIIASFSAPFLPLIPLFIPFLFFPLLFFPFFLPLLLPLLFFLPIVPVTTPPTAVTGRKKREATQESNLMSNRTWTILDEKWKNGQTRNNTARARFFKTRGRPVTIENRRHDFRSHYDHYEHYGKFNQYEPEESENLLQLTQKVVESQHCIERVACELASHNESKIYQAAVMWALGKVHSFAPEVVKRKIEKYSHAYETGAQRRSSDYCQERFHCQRPRVILIQGKSTYNVF